MKPTEDFRENLERWKVELTKKGPTVEWFKEIEAQALNIDDNLPHSDIDDLNELYKKGIEIAATCFMLKSVEHLHQLTQCPIEFWEKILKSELDNDKTYIFNDILNISTNFQISSKDKDFANSMKVLAARRYFKMMEICKGMGVEHAHSILRSVLGDAAIAPVLNQDTQLLPVLQTHRKQTLLEQQVMVPDLYSCLAKGQRLQKELNKFIKSLDENPDDPEILESIKSIREQLENIQLELEKIKNSLTSTVIYPEANAISWDELHKSTANIVKPVSQLEAEITQHEAQFEENAAKRVPNEEHFPLIEKIVADIDAKYRMRGFQLNLLLKQQKKLEELEAQLKSSPRYNEYKALKIKIDKKNNLIILLTEELKQEQKKNKLTEPEKQNLHSRLEKLKKIKASKLKQLNDLQKSNQDTAKSLEDSVIVVKEDEIAKLETELKDIETLISELNATLSQTNKSQELANLTKEMQAMKAQLPELQGIQKAIDDQKQEIVEGNRKAFDLKTQMLQLGNMADFISNNLSALMNKSEKVLSDKYVKKIRQMLGRVENIKELFTTAGFTAFTRPIKNLMQELKNYEERLRIINEKNIELKNLQYPADRNRIQELLSSINEDDIKFLETSHHKLLKTARNLDKEIKEKELTLKQDKLFEEIEKVHAVVISIEDDKEAEEKEVELMKELEEDSNELNEESSDEDDLTLKENISKQRKKLIEAKAFKEQLINQIKASDTTISLKGIKKLRDATKHLEVEPGSGVIFARTDRMTEKSKVIAKSASFTAGQKIPAPLQVNTDNDNNAGAPVKKGPPAKANSEPCLPKMVDMSSNNNNTAVQTNTENNKSKTSSPRLKVTKSFQNIKEKLPKWLTPEKKDKNKRRGTDVGNILSEKSDLTASMANLFKNEVNVSQWGHEDLFKTRKPESDNTSSAQSRRESKSAITRPSTANVGTAKSQLTRRPSNLSPKTAGKVQIPQNTKTEEDDESLLSSTSSMVVNDVPDVVPNTNNNPIQPTTPMGETQEEERKPVSENFRFQPRQVQRGPKKQAAAAPTSPVPPKHAVVQNALAAEDDKPTLSRTSSFIIKKNNETNDNTVTANEIPAQEEPKREFKGFQPRHFKRGAKKNPAVAAPTSPVPPKHAVAQNSHEDEDDKPTLSRTSSFIIKKNKETNDNIVTASETPAQEEPKREFKGFQPRHFKRGAKKNPAVAAPTSPIQQRVSTQLEPATQKEEEKAPPLSTKSTMEIKTDSNNNNSTNTAKLTISSSTVQIAKTFVLPTDVVDGIHVACATLASMKTASTLDQARLVVMGEMTTVSKTIERKVIPLTDDELDAAMENDSNSNSNSEEVEEEKQEETATNKP